METKTENRTAARPSEPFVLTPENYYSDAANRLYLSNSGF